MFYNTPNYNFDIFYEYEKYFPRFGIRIIIH